MLTILAECTVGIAIVAALIQLGIWLFGRFRDEIKADIKSTTPTQPQS